jgi:hypothetical protein
VPSQHNAKAAKPTSPSVTSLVAPDLRTREQRAPATVFVPSIHSDIQGLPSFWCRVEEKDSIFRAWNQQLSPRSRMLYITTFQVCRSPTRDKLLLATLCSCQPKSTSLALSTQLRARLMLLDTSANRQRLSHPSRRIPVASPAHPCKLDPSAMRLRPATRRRASPSLNTRSAMSGHYVTCQCLTHGLPCERSLSFLNPPSW